MHWGSQPKSTPPLPKKKLRTLCTYLGGWDLSESGSSWWYLDVSGIASPMLLFFFGWRRGPGLVHSGVFMFVARFFESVVKFTKLGSPIGDIINLRESPKIDGRESHFEYSAFEATEFEKK